MIIRAGVPACFHRFTSAAVLAGASTLVSANAFYRHKLGRFWLPDPAIFAGEPPALDSAGFVAMFKYGGYPWTVPQYVELAGHLPWAWWASMDFCCEPQIAADRAEVLARVDRTVAMLDVVRNEAARRNVSPPMPVLQGWFPADYERCADMMGALPDLVGLGSVCRRPKNGPSGFMTILNHLDRVLAPNVGLHLFGVKGAIALAVADHPRVKSIDSMAWDFRARKVAREERRSNTVEHRTKCLTHWLKRHGAVPTGIFA